MNIIEVTGGKLVERNIVEHAVHWCVRKMMPKLRTLDIEVKIKNLDGGAVGYCYSDDPRTFEIEIKKGLTLYDLVSTVCHEMVHVKQYARGELKQLDAGSKWKSKIISDDTEYMEQPWEKEAFRMERDLAIQCFEEISITF